MTSSTLTAITICTTVGTGTYLPLARDRGCQPIAGYRQSCVDSATNRFVPIATENIRRINTTATITVAAGIVPKVIGVATGETTVLGMITEVNIEDTARKIGALIIGKTGREIAEKTADNSVQRVRS